MKADYIYFGENGLTNTSANHVANMAKESIKKVYHAYHDLGGNDVATDLYKKLLDLPTEKKEKEKGEEQL